MHRGGVLPIGRWSWSQDASEWEDAKNNLNHSSVSLKMTRLATNWHEHETVNKFLTILIICTQRLIKQPTNLLNDMGIGQILMLAGLLHTVIFWTPRIFVLENIKDRNANNLNKYDDWVAL